MKKHNPSKKNLIVWARNCHYDGLIAVKEVKGKKWMSVLSFLEVKDDFNIDDYSIDDSWKLILKSLNSLTDDEVDKLNTKRYYL